MKKQKIGSVLVWEKINFDKNNIHRHIGFYVGRNMAISNSSESGCPVRHYCDWAFEGKRKIEMIFWNSKLK